MSFPDLAKASLAEQPFQLPIRTSDRPVTGPKPYGPRIGLRDRPRRRLFRMCRPMLRVNSQGSERLEQLRQPLLLGLRMCVDPLAARQAITESLRNVRGRGKSDRHVAAMSVLPGQQHLAVHIV